MARTLFRLSPVPIILALTIGLVPAGGGALAQTLCSEPVTPVCATAIPATGSNQATDREVARRRCSEDAGAYREKLVEYRQCLRDSLAEASAGVEATDRFIQCLDDGGQDCELQEAR